MTSFNDVSESTDSGTEILHLGKLFSPFAPLFTITASVHTHLHLQPHLTAHSSEIIPYNQ